MHNAIDIICDRRSQWIKKLPECFVLERSSPYVDIAKGLIAKVQDTAADCTVVDRVDIARETSEIRSNRLSKAVYNIMLIDDEECIYYLVC